jgi:capsular exopolysaccharide synthesis family protein
MKESALEHLSGQQEISLRELWRVALRRRWVIVVAALSVFTLVALYSFLVTPTYTAVGQLLIDREPNILSFEDVFQIESFKDDYFQTQYRLLQSRALAGDTVDRMRLDESQPWTKALMKKGNVRAEDLKNNPAIRRKLIDSLLGRLVIRPVRKTRLVQASFSHPDPKFAAETLNSLFDAYIEMNVEKRYKATEQATDFLATQIASVQAEIEASEKKLQDYGEQKNIIALSSTENTVIEKLGELNKALTDAQIDRVNKETYYNEIVVATPDYIPDALANPLIQKLREEYTRLNRDYVKKSETFLPNYPEMQSLKAEMDTAKKALEDETQALIKRAYSDFQAAQKKEEALAAVFNRQRREAFQLNSNAIQYNSLQIQIQNQKNLLESLMKRKSETDVSSRLRGLRTSNIWIVDKAEIPSSPSSPNKLRNMVFALMIGVLGGLGLAFLFESLDVTIKNAEDVKKYAGIPMLGIVPEFLGNGMKRGYGKADDGKKPELKEKLKQTGAGLLDRVSRAVGAPRKPEPEPAPPLQPSKRVSRAAAKRTPEWLEGDEESMDLIVHFSPTSSFSEYYRSIRTTLLLTASEAKMQSLAVTSALPQEGKTATISNLAVALAQAGKRVVIIDADLRKPRLHKIFRIKNLNGLTKYLTADVPLEDLTRATAIPTLFFINAGPVPPNPVELLGSQKMANLLDRLKKNYDFILVDTPPLLAVSDAVVLGPRLDGAILVVQRGKTPREALKQACEKLDMHKIKGTGVIINYAQTRDFDYYYTDSYYHAYGGSRA